jgi:hypothetical protein
MINTEDGKRTLEMNDWKFTTTKLSILNAQEMTEFFAY